MHIIKIVSSLAKRQQFRYLQYSYTSHIAFIDEENCIGCTKCVDRCPADAIVGGKRFLHTIIAHYCTGCNLCPAVCPTNCITMEPVNESISPINAKRRYQAHVMRLQRKQPAPIAQKPVPIKLDPRKQAVAEAIERAKQKKMQLKSQFNPVNKHHESD